MKKKNIPCIAAVVLGSLMFMTLSGCKQEPLQTRPVAGTIEQAVPENSLPEHVRLAMDKGVKYHCHELLSDTEHEIAVASIDEVGETSTEGYGIQMTKGAITTTFPDIRNSRQPQVAYNPQTGDLWLTGSAMEGTGVHVDRLYQIRFGDNEIAYVKTAVDPYDVQQALLERIRFTVKGDDITLYDGDKKLTTVTNTVKDMGGFDDESPLWIGEQLYYDLSGSEPMLLFVPGIKFTTGLVLTYDDMPELSAGIAIDDNGQLTIREIKISK